MKGWKEYFEQEVQKVNEEHHMKTKEDQVEWICETIGKLSIEEVEEIYNLIEDKLEIID